MVNWWPTDPLRIVELSYSVSYSCSTQNSELLEKLIYSNQCSWICPWNTLLGMLLPHYKSPKLYCSVPYPRFITWNSIIRRTAHLCRVGQRCTPIFGAIRSKTELSIIPAPSSSAIRSATLYENLLQLVHLDCLDV